MGDVGGGIGENTIDELTDDLSVDYGVNLRGQTRGESDGRESVQLTVVYLETAAEDPAAQTADPVLRGAQLWVWGNQINGERRGVVRDSLEVLGAHVSMR